MFILSPRIAFDPLESAMGYAARLAAFHTGGRTASLSCDLKINLQHLRSGKPEVVQQLAQVAGVPSELLAGNVPLSVGDRYYDIRGERVSSEFLSSPYTVFCPACVLADDQASGGKTGQRRHQWTWQLAVVRTCPTHKIPLVSRKAKFSGDRYHELAVMVPETGERLAELAGAHQTRPVSPLQSYVISRLDGNAGPAWLDGEGLEQAVRTSEMLGALLLFGAKINLDSLTQDQWDRAGAAGFEITAQGVDGIRRALAEVQARTINKGGQIGPQAVFGALFQWLSNPRGKKDPGDIKRILRDYVFENMAMPAGSHVLGEVLGERRLHTCASLARECDVDRRTLRSLLEAKGLIPADTAEEALHVFDAHLGREIAESMRRLVPVNSLPKRLRCTRPLAEQLMEERILSPIVTEVTWARGRTKKSVDEKDIKELIHRLHVKANPVGSVPDGMVDLAKAAMKANAPAGEIVHLILAGYLKNVVRMIDGQGFDAIYLDPAEAKAIVSEVMIGLSPMEVFGRLRIPVASGWELVQMGILPSQKILTSDGKHVIHRFPLDAAERFLSEFTTEVHIGAALELGVDGLKQEMKAAGAKPMLLKKEIGARIFRRSELPERFRV